MFQSVLWVVPMLFSSVTTSVPTFAKLTTRTWWTVHTSFGNITNYLSANAYLTQFDLSSWWWYHSPHSCNEAFSCYFQRPSSQYLTNDSYHAEVVCNIWFVDTPSSAPCSSTFAGGLCIIAIMILCVWDQTSVNNQFHYIYYYYDILTKPRIK